MVALKPMTELAHQKALVKWAKLNRITLVHIPNEGKRSLANGANLRLAGLSQGFPDLLLPEAYGGYFGLLLEVKRNKRYRPSEMNTPTWKAQLAWIQKLNDLGYYAKMVFGWEDGMQAIKAYMSKPKTLRGYYEHGRAL
jgi:hypothetical protein